jgi:hypothetical protein
VHDRQAEDSAVPQAEQNRWFGSFSARHELQLAIGPLL